MNLDLHRVLHQFTHDIDHPAIAQIRHILLEGQSKDGDPASLYRIAGMDQLLDNLPADIDPHAIVDTAAGQDHLGDIAQDPRLMGQVVGIHPDTMPSHKPRLKAQKVPLGGGGSQHLVGIDTHLVEDKRQLIHERNIEISLGILNDLSCLGDLDSRRPVHTGLNHRAIDRRDCIQCLWILPGDDLDNGGEGMFFITGIDPLRRITHKKLNPALQSRLTFKHRDTLLLGGTGIYGRLIDHNATALQLPSYGLRGVNHRGEIGLFGLIDRGGDSDDMEISSPEIVRIRGIEDICSSQVLRVYLMGPVYTPSERLDADWIDVKSDHLPLFSKRHRDR